RLWKKSRQKEQQKKQKKRSPPPSGRASPRRTRRPPPRQTTTRPARRAGKLAISRGGACSARYLPSRCLQAHHAAPRREKPRAAKGTSSRRVCSIEIVRSAQPGISSADA